MPGGREKKKDLLAHLITEATGNRCWCSRAQARRQQPRREAGQVRHPRRRDPRQQEPARAHAALAEFKAGKIKVLSRPTSPHAA